MDHSITFARHFARLVWLLIHEPTSIEEQKASLRALVLVSRDGAVTLSVGGESLLANDQPIAPVVSGARDTAARLETHGAGAISVAIAAQAADMLAAARLLAGPEEEEPIAERLLQAGAVTVHFVMARGTPALSLFDDLELVLDAQVPIEPTLVSPPTLAPAPRAADPRRDTPAYGAGNSMFDQFAAVRPQGGHAALLQELAVTPDHLLGAVVERVAQAAEQAHRDGDGRAALDILLALTEREARLGDVSRREVALAMRRVVTSHGLRLIAALVPRRVVPRERVERALGRAPEESADVVIELLTQAQTATDRRAYFDLLLALKAGVPTLLHMLGDQRWYVVRNAVDLLGELGVAEAEGQVTRLLQHEDERVRQSATMALLRMNTPAGRAAVLAAVQSESRETRQQAVIALGARRDASTASMLLRALDREDDEAVQRSIYAALGKVASDDAVARLIAAAEPAGGLFRRKSATLRAAAVLALGEAKTRRAVDALHRLADDREKEVRDAVLRALANARRGDEPRVTGLFERP